MHPFIEPCLPTISRTVPSGSEWAYEIKHDGFRFLAVRQGKQVRIYSRGGHDWAERLPAITEAMRALPVRSVVLDGEGVICGADGKSDFRAMRACFSRQGAPEAFLYAFDVLELGGIDLPREPCETRRATLASLLRSAAGGLRPRLPHGPRGHHRQAARSAVSVRTVRGLGQGEEPGCSSDVKVGG